MSSPELRKDPVLSRWILFPSESPPAPAASCVACASAELELAPGVIAPPAPVLDRRLAVDRASAELYTKMSGAGEHELIVESKEHGKSWADFEVAELQAVLALWRERLLFFRQDNRFRHMAIVKREGAAAGAIAPGHACSEAFALPLVPPSVKEKIVGIQGYHRKTGSCAYCDIVRFERNEKTRRIEESMRHIALAPYASRSPFEVCVLPKGHHFDFAESSDADLGDLAGLLAEVIARLEKALEDVAFVLYLQTAPPDMGADLQQFHWHLELHPRLAFPEALGAVLEVNAVTPEHAARVLREVAL